MSRPCSWQVTHRKETRQVGLQNCAGRESGVAPLPSRHLSALEPNVVQAAKRAHRTPPAILAAGRVAKSGSHALPRHSAKVTGRAPLSPRLSLTKTDCVMTPDGIEPNKVRSPRNLDEVGPMPSLVSSRAPQCSFIEPVIRACCSETHRERSPMRDEAGIAEQQSSRQG